MEDIIKSEKTWRLLARIRVATSRFVSCSPRRSLLQALRKEEGLLRKIPDLLPEGHLSLGPLSPLPLELTHLLLCIATVGWNFLEERSDSSPMKRPLIHPVLPSSCEECYRGGEEI